MHRRWIGKTCRRNVNAKKLQHFINQSIIYLNQAARPIKTKQTHRQKNKKEIHRIRNTEMTDIIKHHKSKHKSKHGKLSNGRHDRIKTHDEQTYAKHQPNYCNVWAFRELNIKHFMRRLLYWSRAADLQQFLLRGQLMLVISLMLHRSTLLRQ